MKEIYHVKGNEPILLNNPNIVWIVQSGTVALFAVTIDNGAIKGHRRYLFSQCSGDALFGTANEHHQILAVPMGEVQLLQVEQAYFQEAIALGESQAFTLIENWLQEFSSVLTLFTQPMIQVKAQRQPARYSLNNNQTFQPEAGAICWVKIHQGRVRWMGFEELTFDATSEVFPITDIMWLQASGAVQLSTQITSTIQNPEILLSGLSQLHTQFLSCIALHQQQEIQEEFQRLQEQANSNYRVTAEALGDLASALGSYEATLFLEGAPLLVVAGAVGKALGVKIRPPARSEDLKRFKDPLEAIVRSSRLRMRRVLLRDNWWQRNCGPLVAYLENNNRPVALLPLSSTRYEVFDPIEQTRTPVNEQIALTLSPVACMFYRSLPDKVLKGFDVFRFALKGQVKNILLIVAIAILTTLLGMLTPQATVILIDNAIPDSDKGLLLQVGVGLLIVALATTVFRLTQGLALLRMETVSDSSTQAAVWDRLLNLPISFFRQYTTGDLQSRVSSITTIRRQLSGTTLINLIGGIFALLNLALLFFYSWKLAIVALIVAILTLAVTAISGIILVRKVRPLLEMQGNIFGQTVQIVNGISKLRVAGAEMRAFAVWSKNYSKQVKLDLSTQFIDDIVAVFNTVMPTLTSAVIFWLTIRLLEESLTSKTVVLSIGTFLAFNTAFGTFIRGVTNVSNIITDALQVLPQWQRAQPILETIPEVDLSKADPGKLSGRIVVDCVTFRYRKDGLLTLDNVNIHAEPGEFIALVGGSGSGKSTLFRLLLGFETPEDGAIYYDGQDLSGLDVDAVRRQLGVVLQNGRLQSASIFDNIAGGANITLDEAWEAVRMSGLAEDIKAMPMQMHTVVSEGGGNLSGGQRQRLLIARALVLKPRILLFDEATSALDNRTQAIVSESLNKLQVTRLVIAHRLSTIRNAHRIYVLQSGRVIQQGGFDELVSQEGLFAQLMARQMA
ncbi:NHLP bacteriocin export ABC transporter permease/ATPase subunit [Scytonema sp. UIC 10036]|uniref:NHLP bacteriocin export ABC transporter permease/ATPase subunit n=1 Tax=Scytonema sp. UIC 10036 TaxID=2304196 RepID=UPI0012DA17A6|nr:NHLP bacteriocin export ABC transporter permease/ATPase subunit [Scytonema sp. UIC 10036]MUG91965.1 NHLP bacteriocin export ABC transporter permease/ATPase subunit [Scytonema sp. UIC 10036]